jgi:predicted flap endonuclease-1-like 5' DNA nuclease
MSELVSPKNYINLIAGVVNLVFEQLANININLPTAKVTIESDTALKSVVLPAIVETMPAKSDDLTVINGIGPTFAKRLQAAGITSFQALASASPEHIKEVAKLADWQANPADWIAAAKALA